MGNRFSNASCLPRRRWAGYIKSCLWAAPRLGLAHECEGSIGSALARVSDEHVLVTAARPDSVPSPIVRAVQGAVSLISCPCLGYAAS